MTPAPLRIGTDGGCSPNPGPMGWAWVDEHGNWRAGSAPDGTNNMAELTAIEHAIDDHPDQPLTIESDSQYAINCLTVWGPGWIADGVAGKKNQAQIERIIRAFRARTHPVELVWVRGHSSVNAHPLNTVADRFASEFARRRTVSDERGTTSIDWAPGPVDAPTRKRRASQSRGGRGGRVLSARYPGTCPHCAARYPAGTPIRRDGRTWIHADCPAAGRA